MMAKGYSHDQLLAQRWVDGLLGPRDRAAVEARLASDEAFQALVAELEAVRACFAACDSRAKAPPGFAARVILAARGLPAVEPMALVRHLSWAAAVLLLLGLGAMAWLRASQGDRTLTAADSLETRYERLLEEARRLQVERARRESGPSPLERRP